MALARVVTFEGVDAARIAELKSNIETGERPENLPATEMMILHDPDADRSIAIVFFDNEDDYRQGDAVLDAMPTDDTPGRRTSVGKYEVALRTMA
jgi:hypothetical protein